MVVGHCAAADRYAAIQIVALHGVARVAIRAARSVALNAVLNVARVEIRAALNAVRSVSVADLAPSVAPVVTQVAVQAVAQVVFPETKQALQVVRCAGRFVARDCCAACFRYLADRATVSPLPRAAPAAPCDLDVPDVPRLWAGLMTDFRFD